MTFETLNSVYRVQGAGDHFLVTKIREKSESSFNAVGQSRLSKAFTIAVGYPACFDGWQTSRVTKLLEDE